MRQNTAESHADTLSHEAIAPASNDQTDSLALSSLEQLSVVRTIRICSGIGTLEEFSVWLSEGLDSLLRHEEWACGLGRLHREGYAATHWLSSRTVSGQFCPSRATPKNLVSPMLSSWLKVRRPQISVRSAGHDASSAAGNLFAPVQPENVALHCQMDLDNKWTSVFAFANMDEKPGFRQRLLLDLLVPHLHATLCRIVAQEAREFGHTPVAPAKLTARELQILRYIQLGRTNAEIADLMFKSVFTVNNQVVKVLAKLAVKNRTQAVFVAKEMGLFTP